MRIGILFWLLGCGIALAEFHQYSAKWEQVGSEKKFVLGLEREVYEPIDAAGRFVIALQAGAQAKPEAFFAKWVVSREELEVASGEGSLAEGMLVVDFPLKELKIGTYQVRVEVWEGPREVGVDRREFELRADSMASSPISGRIPLIFPSGIPPTKAGYPLSIGVPFPPGALKDLGRLRVVNAAGKPIPAQFIARGGWGYASQAGIRWLGVDIQSSAVSAWWPERKTTPYFLEYGLEIGPRASTSTLNVIQSNDGVRVDTGPLQFLIRSDGFNLIDDVTLRKKKVLNQAGKGGPYLIDQEGAIYRAANDARPQVMIEESGPLRAVIRVEGWFVKEGTSGNRTHYRLPTDRLCRFVTRVEAYAGLPWVRVLHTWINTSDSYHVAFRDLGFSLLRPENREVEFGVLGEAPIKVPVKPDGVYLIQHLPDRFAVCREDGQEIASGKRSDGVLTVTDAAGALLTVGHRETWQRFPKEMEVLPDELRFHVWPAHGRDHPEIDPYARDRYHQLWFAHQGKLLDLKFPWQTLFAVMRFTDNPSTSIYKPAGTAMGGVQSSAMGIAITSDFQIRFGEAGEVSEAQMDAAAFQARPVANAHPDWVASSMALGPIHPYDPKRFPELEKAAEDAIFGIWKLQDITGEYGMFLYRGWHHNPHEGRGFWNPYRLYSAGHHYESYMPWLYFARSGDPRHAEIGMATMRHLTDLGMIHYDNPRYEHEEFETRQKRLVGSTRHTNGFVFWGGDHAILGHPTSYGGVILAYYLTGDLRYLQVLTEEWQKTLLDDRANPQWAKATATMNWGENVREINRDNNNAVGELLDLYQLTYDPRLLALIQPCVEGMKQNMYEWGMGLENALIFRRTPQLRTQLIEAAETRRADPMSDKYKAIPRSAMGPGRWALAAWLEPEKGFEREALWEADIPATVQFSESFLQEASPTQMPYEIADRFLYQPRLLHSTRKLVDAEGLLGPSQELPMASELGGKHPTRVVVREDADTEFTIRLRGTIRSGDARLTVLDESGGVVCETVIPSGKEHSVTVPKDGRTGEYLLLLYLQANEDKILTPLTNLPKEVYPSSYWISPTPTRFFVGAPNSTNGQIKLEPGKNTYAIESNTGNSILMERKADSFENPLVCEFPSGGAWLRIRNGKYFSTLINEPLIMAVSPEYWFEPTSAVPISNHP